MKGAADAAVDVAIVGAGAAGLGTALTLAGAGRSVVILEARDRVGGRIRTVDDPRLPTPVELGAEFIHGESPETFRVLNETGIAAIDAPRDHWTLRAGELERAEDLFDDIRRLLQPAAALARDESVESFLERSGSDRSLDGARGFARRMVEGFDAADPKRASIRAIAAEWNSEGVVGSAQFRPSAGYGALMRRMADSLPPGHTRLRLQHVIRSIRWSKGSVVLEGLSPEGPFQVAARRTVITLPISILQLAPDSEAAVRFEPPLTQLREALDGLALGPVVKVVMRFRSAFWERAAHGRYRDAAFFHVPEAVIPTFWTALPWRIPVLTAWAGGPRAERLSALDRTQIVDHTIDSLQRLFGQQHDPRSELEDVYMHDWQRDPFAQGAYSYVTVDGSGARATLCEPLLDTLFFAGEALDTQGEASTVGGALRSGVQAARRILSQDGMTYDGHALSKRD